uniref:Uncharacterized protein n=1 Tax=Anguilla anguilla TaxID=7936 RepID=A0A0E9TNR3_ANGAN
MFVPLLFYFLLLLHTFYTTYLGLQVFRNSIITFNVSY